MKKTINQLYRFQSENISTSSDTEALREIYTELFATLEKLKAVVGEETLGTILKALRGYAVVTDGEISLSSEALRMWLRDSTHNAEFGV